MKTPRQARRPRASNKLKLQVVRAVFALGGHFAPRSTMDRAARLFATPLASSRSRARAAQPDVGMQRHEIQANDQTIAMYTWGDPTREPYALLVHGWSSFGLRFLPWVTRLREAGFAVVTFDQPGHGNSSGKLCTLPNFIDTIHAIGSRYGNAALAIGHSLGGAAVALAQGEKWRADRIVVIAPPATMEAAAERFLKFLHLGPHLHEKFIGLHKKLTGVNVRDWDVRHHLASLGQPCLVVHDLDDLEVPWGDGELYARHWQTSSLLTTEGLGHHKVVDAPEVIEAALAFVRGDRVGNRIVASPNLPFGLA